ncbi:MAG: DUF3472 domain-containing protein [Ruminococcaceae bacterium]|nr:DUF3472 domain-containing protein [Oscillospiraceae bacterium]
MKNRVLKCLVALALILSMTAGYALCISAEGEMAYNIYSEPVFEGEEAFTTYSIDMRADQVPDATYWSLANFHMHISDLTKQEYRDIEAGGAYAGIQHAGNQKKAIMAFWEWHYWPEGKKTGVEETNLVADRIYPPGKNDFGGEGEGVNYIGRYNWKDSQWYRMVLHTWENPTTGTTYCGQWMQDLTTGKYTLISYFDTKMRQSYLEGNMHFFMENFYGYNLDQERDVKMKNIYAKQKKVSETGEVTWEWTSVNSTALSHCNNWANNKIGAHSFGATEEYFWGRAGGTDLGGQTQKEHDAAWPKQVFTINQPDQPDFGTVQFEKILLRKRGDEWTATWSMADGSTPQLSYSLKIKDDKGNVLVSETAMKPEVFYKVLDTVKTDVFVCEMSITDIFGNTASFAEATEQYKALYGEPVIGDDAPAAKNNSFDLGMIIGIAAAAAVVVIGGAVVVTVVVKKKKTNA